MSQLVLTKRNHKEMKDLLKSDQGGEFKYSRPNCYASLTVESYSCPHYWIHVWYSFEVCGKKKKSSFIFEFDMLSGYWEFSSRASKAQKELWEPEYMIFISYFSALMFEIK